MQIHSKNRYNKAKYCQKHQSFDADIPKYIRISVRQGVIATSICQMTICIKNM